MEKKDINLLSSEISKKIIPDLEKTLEKFQDFSIFFHNIKKISWLNNCDIQSDIQPNPAQEDGLYPNQNILQLSYKNKIINFDCNEGGLLDSKFNVVEDSGVVYEIFNSKSNVGIKYDYDEVISAYNYLNDHIGTFKSLKYQRINLSADEFKSFLENDYKFIYEDDLIYLQEDNFRLYLNVNFDSKDIDFTNEVQFYKDNEWQDKINLVDELNNQLKLRKSTEFNDSTEEVVTDE